VVAVVVSWMRVTAPVTGGTLPAWPGIALAITGAGLLLAATPVFEWAAGTAWGVAASRASLLTRARLVGRRGTVALTLGALALTAPAIAAAYWLATGVHGPLTAAAAPVLPPFIAASPGAQDQARTLVLRREQGILTYQVLRNSDPVLGGPELAELSVAIRPLDTAVASLAATDSGDSQDAAQALSQFAIGYVLLPAPVDPVLAGQLDGLADLTSLTRSSAYDLWRVAGTVARVRVLTAAGTVVAVPSGVVGANSVVAPSVAGTLVLAEPAGGWTATLSGRALAPLPRPVNGWAQGFVLPAGGGRLIISHDDLGRDLALALQGVVLLVVFVLALPGTRSGSADLTEAVPADAVHAQTVQATQAVPAMPAMPAVPAMPAMPAVPAIQVQGPQAEPVPVAASEPVSGEVVAAGAAAAAESEVAQPPVADAARIAWAETEFSSPVGYPAAGGDPRGARKRGGSHRASRHGKPARSWRGKASATPAEPAPTPAGSSSMAPPGEARRSEPQGSGRHSLATRALEWHAPQPHQHQPSSPPDSLGPDLGQASADLALAMPNLFSTPEEAEEGVPEAPWAQAEVSSPPPEPAQSESRPPWELGGLP
jgi:hypothetical protein